MHSSNLPRTLAEWLEYQQRVHPRDIELGLQRIREVWLRLGAPQPAPVVITVAGTNGKGSTIAFLDAILRAQGKRVGTYTSPHLLRYNERVRVAGVEVDDVTLITEFTRIEAARGDIALTYFEFATLGALLVFAASALDVAILEVGLGGRLDAVNLIDADAAVVTTIDLDHQEWLGSDRDAIGREKAGVFRHGRPAILGDADPPGGLTDAATECAALIFAAGHEFNIEIGASGWSWSNASVRLELPHPALDAPCQHANAAAAIAALHALRDHLDWSAQAIADGLVSVRLAARMQRVAGPPELVIDVAHNPQAARTLAAWLAAHPVEGRNLAVFAALGDKDVEGIAAALLPHVADWHLAGLDRESPRGLNVDALVRRFPVATAIGGRHDDVGSALRAAEAMATAADRIVAFGSFFVAGAALRHAQQRGGS